MNLNLMAAEKIMNWEIYSPDHWHPTTELHQALECLKRLPVAIYISKDRDSTEWKVTLYPNDGVLNPEPIEATAITLPEAITVACLRAVGVEV